MESKQQTRQLRPRRIGRPCRRCGGTERFQNYVCVACNRERARSEYQNKPRVRTAAREAQCVKRYGITLADKAALLAAQGGCCRICRSPEPRTALGWAVDHCHQTGKVRGVLCGDCNRGCGGFRDDPEIARLGYLYLLEHAAAK